MSRFFTTPGKKPLAIRSSGTPSPAPTPSYNQPQPFVAYQAVHAHFPQINDTINRAPRRHLHLYSSSSDGNDEMEVEQEENYGGDVSREELGQENQEDPEHASSVSFDPTSNLLFRLLQSSTILEIRSLAVGFPSSVAPPTSAELVLRITFPHRLRPLPQRCTYQHPSTGEITVVLMSERNEFHRITLPALGSQQGRPYLDYDPKAARGSSLTNRIPLEGWVGPWEVIDDETLFLTAGDGLSKFVWSPEAQGYSHMSIKAPSNMSLSSLLSRQNLSSTTPSQAVSITSYLEGDSTAFIYTISRDRKLRAWGVAGQSHQFMLDLGAGESGMVLEPGISHLQTFGDSWVPNVHYLAVYLPRNGQSVFKLLKVTYHTSQVQSIELLHTLSSKVDRSADLRGFLVEGLTSATAGEDDMDVGVGGSGSLKRITGWRLWSSWVIQERAVLRWADVSGLLAPTREGWEAQEMVRIGINGSSHSIYETDRRGEWQTVSTPLEDQDRRLDISHFDRIIPESLSYQDHEGDGLDLIGDILEVFEREIFHPGRFSAHSISSTLDEYISSLRETLIEEAGGDPDTPKPLELDAQYTTILEKVKAVIGCMYHVHREEHTGRRMISEYRRAVRGEWLGFWAGVKGKDRAGRWPLAIALGGMGQSVVGLTKEGIVGVGREDEAGLIRKIATAEEWEKDVDSIMEVPTGQLRLHYPTLARQATRDILVLSHSAAILVAGIDEDVLRLLAGKIDGALSSPMEASSEELAESVWKLLEAEQSLQDTVQQVEHHLTGCTRWRKGLNGILDMLVDLSISPPSVGQAEELQNTFTGWSLTISASAQLINTRHALARDVLVLVLYLTVGKSGRNDDVELDGDDLELIARSFSVFHQLSVIKWVEEQDGSEALYTANEADAEKDDGEELYKGFEGLNVDASASVPSGVDGESTYSVLHALCLRQVTPPTFRSGIDLLGAAATLLATIGLLSSASNFNASANAVVFANTLMENGHPALALDMASWYATGTGISYVQAKALSASSIDRLEEAIQRFEAVAAKISVSDWAKSDKTGLALVLPFDILFGGLSAYYQHVMGMFESSDNPSAVIKFAHEAINSLNENDPAAENLWNIIFKNQLALKAYEEAYSAMTQNPFAKLWVTVARGHRPQQQANIFNSTSGSDAAGKDRPLGNLINAMCQENEAERLLDLSFSGLEAAVEEELTFKARNSDPLLFPNYNQVLYSWLMKMADYKTAGGTMYSQGRWLGDHMHLGADDFYPLASMQAQSYLAAISALSLIDEKNAWISIPATQKNSVTGRNRKRRRVDSLIPASEFSEYKKEIEIVTLQEVRRDYANALATLKVADRVSRGSPYGSVLSAKEILDHQCREGLFDDAIATGSSLGADLTSVFEALTANCIQISSAKGDDCDDADWLEMSPETSTWRGTLPDKAWRYLQIQLERHDTPASNFKYREAVMTVILLGRHNPPPWLVDSEMQRYPEKLLQTALQTGVVDSAVEWALKRIRKTPQVETGGTTKNQPPTFTSYSAIDRVISRARLGANAHSTDLNSITDELKGRLSTAK